jgi:hypothetical protein
MVLLQGRSCQKPGGRPSCRSLVKAIRTNLAFRSALAVLVLIAFTVLSNHCALAKSMARDAGWEGAERGDCCHQESAPAKQKSPCPQVPTGCCTTLKVTMPDEAKVPGEPVAAPAPLVATWLEMLIPERTEREPAEPGSDHPPNVPGFVELVLHRSLHSHAPPPFAA